MSTAPRQLTAIALATFVLFLAASCADKRKEISEHPEILRDPALSISEIRLLGVRFGDPESRIPRNAIKGRQALDNWVLCVHGAQFRVSDGHVVEFHLSDLDGGDILKKLDIVREDQVEIAFGKADKVREEVYGAKLFGRSYTYLPRHMTVQWSVEDSKLKGIMISR